MKQGSFFITFLLTIVALEICVLIYDVFRPNPQNRPLDSFEYTLPAQVVKMQPIMLEDKFVDNVDKILDSIANEISEKLLISKMAQSSIILQKKREETAMENAKIMAIKEAIENKPQVQEEKQPEVKKFALKEGEKPMIALIIDDVGLSEPFVKAFITLQKPLNASFLPYGAANKGQMDRLKEAGFEIMLHVPMMPHIPADLAPVTLSPEMDKTEVQKDLAEMFERFAGAEIAGVNNHMGSLFTERTKVMEYFMEILQQKKLFFVDSKTTAHSVGKEVAEKYGVPYITRDVFIDNKNDFDYILAQLKQAEKVAMRNGYAVAIGHPRAQTFKALAFWLKDIENNGFTLVHVSDLIKRINEK